MDERAEIGDVFVTATGDKNVIARHHLERMKDGAIIANTGHFNVEIELAALAVARGLDAQRRGPTSRSTCSPTAGACSCSPRVAW